MGDKILKKFSYKGYLTKMEYSVDDLVFYGKIDGIRDLVSFSSVSEVGFELEFHAAVDEYLQMCDELGIPPAKVEDVPL